MFEKFRRRNRDGYDGNDYNGGTGFQGGNGYADDQTAAQQPVGTRTAVGGRDTDGDGRPDVVDRDGRTSVMDRDGDGRADVTERGRARTHAVPATAAGTAAGATTVAEAREAQRERYGGADGTAIFFGWLSALGLAALLMAVVAAAGTRLGFASDVSTNDATSNAGTIGIVGAAILVVILLLAYYGGGYVAGRMARFDGGRQGFRVWLLGLLVTIAAAVAGWIGGSQYNIFEQLNLPRIPVSEGDVATGAIITLVVVLVGTLLAAVAGGKAGDRYHARVDRFGWDRNRV
jgi:hypothetical protein